MSKIKVYIAGPMTDMPDHNFPAFNAAQKELEDLGYDVVNPASFGVNPSETWSDCLKRDLPLMWECDAVIRLERSWRSKGAELECTVARAFGIPVIELTDILGNPPHYRQHIRKAQEIRNGPKVTG